MWACTHACGLCGGYVGVHACDLFVGVHVCRHACDLCGGYVGVHACDLCGGGVHACDLCGGGCACVRMAAGTSGAAGTVVRTTYTAP